MGPDEVRDVEHSLLREAQGDAESFRSLSHLGVDERREQEDDLIRCFAEDLLGEVEPGHRRHQVVEHDHRRAVPTPQRDGLLRVGSLDDLEVGASQDVADQRTDVRLVVGNEDVDGRNLRSPSCRVL